MSNKNLVNLSNHNIEITFVTHTDDPKFLGIEIYAHGKKPSAQQVLDAIADALLIADVDIDFDLSDKDTGAN